MGVKLPDFTELGYGDPRSAGGLPVYPQEDPVAAGEKALGVGLDKVGDAAMEIGIHREMQKNRLEQALATTSLFNSLTPLHEQISKETDPTKLAELRGQYNTLLSTSGSGISDPYARKMWEATHAKTIAQAHADADARNTGLDREQAVAGIWRQRDAAVRNAVASDDPLAIPNAQMAIGNLGKYAGDYGALDPKQQYIFEKQSQNQLYEGRADRLIEQGKADEASKFLDANRDKIDSTALERLQMRAAAKGRKNNADGIALEALGLPSVGIGSLPSVPAPAPTGLPGTGPDKVDNWETQHNNFGGMRKVGVVAGPNAGGFQEFPTPEEGVAAISRQLDRYVSGATTGKPLTTIRQIVSTWAPPNENPTDALIARASKVVGTDPDTPLNLADPNVKAKLIEATIRNEQGGKLPVNPAIITAVAGAPQGMPSADQQLPTNAPAGAQPVADQQPQSRTGLPSLTQTYMNILRNPRVKTDQDVRDAFSTATAVHNAMEADAARAERIQAQRAQQAMKQREDQIWADAYSPNPQITASQIAVDPAFSGNPERRKAMIEIINNPPGSSVPAAQSYAAALSLIDRIRLPEGDSNKITDEGQIYPLMRSMNRTDFDYVRKTLNDIRAPGGEAFAKEEDRFFKDLGPFIDKSNPIAGSMDPVGKGRLYEYHRWVDQKKDELKKAGKNPNDLFDPASPLFVGKPEIISYYQPTLQQSNQSIQDFGKGVLKPLPPLAPWNPPPIPEPFTTGSARQPGEAVEDYLKRTGQQ